MSTSSLNLSSILSSINDAFSGKTNGIDVQSTVAALMQIERRPEAQMQQQQSDVSQQISMLGAVQPFISGGISKCVTGGTLNPTEDGLVRIGSFFEGDEADTLRPERVMVASLGGFQKTAAFYY